MSPRRLLTRSWHEAYGPYVAAAAVAISFLLLILAALFTLGENEREQERNRQVQQALCQQTVDNRTATRLTWEAARAFILTRGGDRQDTNEFFEAVLAVIPPLKCVDDKPVGG